MKIIDSHCHLWTLARGDYEWLDPSNTTLAPLLRDFTVSDLHQLQHNTAIERSIVVQAAPSDAETDYLLSIATQAPQAQIAGVVAWADLSAKTFPYRLETLSHHPLCKGIRPMLQDIADTDWILGATQQTNLSLLSQTDLCFDALVTPRHLINILQVCQSHPSLPIIIDHAAKPCLATSNMHSPEYQQWAKDMAILGRETHALCKVSGLLTEMSAAQYATPTKALSILEPLFAQLLTWFGSERLVWGSDWPVVNLASGIEDWLDITAILLDALSPTEQHAIVNANAKRFYRLGDNVT